MPEIELEEKGAGENDPVKDLSNGKVENVNAFPNPGAFSLLVFGWLGDLIKLAYMRNKEESNLEGKDLWELRPDMRAKAVHARFEELWREEMGKKRPSVKRVLWKISRPFLVFSFCVEWIRLVGSFGSPLILREMVLFIQKPEEVSLSRGYMLAMGMLLSALLVALGKSHSFYKALSAGLVVKAASNAAVYHKAIALSNSAKQARTTGEIVNLMSTDGERLFLSFFSVNTIWSAPLQLTISLCLIYREVKDATWAGLGTLFVVFLLLVGVFLRIAKLEAARMKCTDQRVKLLNEMMQGIRVIKLMVWEEPILKAVDAFREKELSIIRSIAYTKAMMIALVLGSTLLAALATFGAYVGVYPELGLDPVNVFTSLALLNMLKFPMMQIPSAISAWSQAMVSMRRLEALLKAEERGGGALQRAEAAEGEVALAVRGGNFAWEVPAAEAAGGSKGGSEGPGEKRHGGGRVPKDAKGAACAGEREAAAQGAVAEQAGEGPEVPMLALEGTDLPAAELQDEGGMKLALKGIDLEVRRGELVMVVGKVGAGKSSLLAALMGEIERVGGDVFTAGSMACVAQAPWIRNATLKDNITFSEAYDDAKFKEVVRVCCLERDVDMLSDGFETEIGERGINLSGGQKARIQLARAVYRGADLYLLDDPLSAVDSHVARTLMQECILSRLRGATVVLVTHQVQFLGAADRVVVMEGGRIVAQGSPSEVEERFDFGSFSAESEEVAGEEQDVAAGEGAGGQEPAATGGETEKEGERAPKEAVEDKGKLVTAEERDKGAVSSRVYMTYLNAFGRSHHLFLAFVAFSMVQIFLELTDFWLAVWSMSFSLRFAPAIPAGIRALETGEWLGVYGALTAATVLATLLRGIYFQMRGVKAGRVLVHNLVERVLGGTMAFFDTTPSGRVLNRFSRDADMVDTQVANMMENYLAVGLWLLGMLGLICILLPWFCVPFVPIVVLYKLTERYVTPAARELQRLDSVSRSPMTSHLSETLQGLSTIRTFGMQGPFKERALEYLDQNLRPQMIGMEVRRWLDVRLELVNLLVQFFTALFLVLSRDHISPSFAGLALTKAMGVGAILGFLVVLKTQLETSMNAVERIHDYSHNIEIESDVVAPERQEVGQEWPSRGCISVQGLSMRYRPGLPLVLKQVSLEIGGGERLGIVGRTGSGKSSFLASLFRLVEAAEGRICIDGIDIAAVGVKVLRSRLSIIPQDPVLFSGSLRFNLDPFDQFSDAEVAQVLAWVQLEMRADSVVAEGGENLSQGQRQLLALARVLLRQPKILMMDEATASVDTKTDQQIQVTVTIQKRILEAKGATMMTIAHRLNTVIASDRIAVMEQGRLAECGSPQALLSSRESLFSLMVDRMGPAAAAALREQCAAVLPEPSGEAGAT